VVAEAAITAALTVPNRTVLLAATALKLFPLMVRTVPALAESGLKELMMGICADDCKHGAIMKAANMKDLEETIVFHIISRRRIRLFVFFTGVGVRFVTPQNTGCSSKVQRK